MLIRHGRGFGAAAPAFVPKPSPFAAPSFTPTSSPLAKALAPAPVTTLRATPPAATSSSLGTLLARATPPVAPVLNTFRATPPSTSPAAIPLAKLAVQNYAPAVPSTTVPVASQSSSGSSIPGIFSKLSAFGAPRPSFQAFQSPSIPVGGLNASPVATSPAQFLDRSPYTAPSAAAIAPYNPPVQPTAVGPTGAAPFINAPPAVQAPPASQGPNGQLPPSPPAGGGFDPGSGYDTGSGAGVPDPYNPGYDMNGTPLPPAAAPASSPNYLLWGALGLGAIFLLTRSSKAS